MSDIEPTIARAVHEWISGRRDGYERFFFAGTTEATAAFAARATDRDALFAPEGDPTSAAREATVIHYGGSLSEPGDELIVAGRSIELQEYAAAAFVDVLGPTIVRFVDGDGWRAFLDDAGIARETGILPPQLRDPRMQLADRAVLLDPLRVMPPDSFCADGDGSVTFGAQGAALGRIDEIGAFETPVPRIAALAGIVPLTDLIDSVVARPWLARLIGLADLRRALPDDRALAPASGFGVVLADDGRADAEPPPHDPFILVLGDEALLADAVTRRQFRLDAQTARVVEIVQTSTTEALALERIAAACRVGAGGAASLARQAVDALGIHHGAAVTHVSVAGAVG